MTAAPYTPIHPWHPHAPAPADAVTAAIEHRTAIARHLEYLQVVAEHLADPEALAAVDAVREALGDRA